jgi:hypothetical protein
VPDGESTGQYAEVMIVPDRKFPEVYVQKTPRITVPPASL